MIISNSQNLLTNTDGWDGFAPTLITTVKMKLEVLEVDL